MTETARIRWTKEDDGGTAGRAGTLDEPLFFIYPPESPGKAHILTAMLPGHTRDFYPSGFVSDLKAKAEEWLEEFASSLGAVFPDEPKPDPDCEECGFGLPRHDKDCSYCPGTTAATTGEDQPWSH